MRLPPCLSWCFALTLSCLLSCHVSSGANVDRAKSMSDVIASDGLYSRSDKVAILNVTTFESTVLNSDVAWLVEFYNTWCGHCQRYAPIWKEFAALVAGWKSAVRIGVVDCVVEANTPLCRDYEIMHYPFVKFFTAHHQKGDIGKEIEKGRDAPEMRRTLAEILEKEQLEGRGSSWPNITPYRSSDLHNLWKDVPSSVLYSILIFKDKKNEVGADLVLDFSQIPSIQTRTVSAENEVLSKLLQVSTQPSIVVIERGKDTGELLYTQDTSHNGLSIALQAFLKTKHIEMPEIEDTEEELVKMPATAYDDNELQKQVKQLMSHKGDIAFLADLEHALRFSLRHEVGSRKQMTGPVLNALRNFLVIIRRHFPLSTSGLSLLNALCSKVETSKDISGEEWKKFLLEEEAKLAAPVWTERKDFLGCHGSQPNFRGYPCSLWTTFHVLTVDALNSASSGQPREVLEAILGYVTHFFGCSECSKHFQEMASETMFSDVTSHKDSVLWLWEAHNTVNKRLAGDATEDPAFPKIQFPSVDRCSGCRDNGAWVKHQVLQYLESIYSHESLSVIGAAGSNSMYRPNKQALSAGSEMSALDMSLLVPWVSLILGQYWL
ncbi:sulfhydryl oxidase 2 isoform X2 [Frankliniella occidentalis]|uniref:Sulfhydryl oxidase n=1 Tax=Frankliniella occidentalis TaxID=133901 RepID=A0A6J1T9D2_FRAOC|nr:sulfhydryl oxidase 2 isoform X2 [Frankliniella occidentalis]